MIIQEIFNNGEIELKHTFSDQKKYIRQVETNVIYDETYDTLDRLFTYEETDEFIPTEKTAEF